MCVELKAWYMRVQVSCGERRVSEALGVSDVRARLFAIYVRYMFIQDVLDASDMVGQGWTWLDTLGVLDIFTPEGGCDVSTPEGGAEQTNMGALTCVLWAFAHIPRRGVETC